MRQPRRSVVENLEQRFLLSTTTYNRNAAVTYANQNYNKVVSDGYFWISGSTADYYGAGQPVPVGVSGEASGIGDDCAHFVSSCIGSPGGGLTIPSRAGTYGEPGAARLDELLVGNSAGGYGTTYAYGELVSSVSQLSPGDVIGYDWDGSGNGSMSGIDHTAIYIGNGEVDCHAESRLDANWTLGGAGDYFFIHITLPDSIVPTTPINSSPGAGAAVANTTPTLSAGSFVDGAIGSSQTAAEWQVYKGSTLVYDSGIDTKDLGSFTVPTGKLGTGTTYTWKVRYEDNYGDWSSYSTATSFTVGGGPVTPVNSLPANNSTAFNPLELTAGAFSDQKTGATQAASEWLVLNSSSTTVFDSGIDATDLTSIAVPNADVTAGQTYTWEVRYEDNSGVWSGYSTPTSFTMASSGTLLTLGGSSGVSQLYVADSADGNYLNIWNSTSDTGTPAQTIELSEIGKIVIDGSSTGSNITLDFSNGNLSPQNRLTIFDNGATSGNTLDVIGSTGNDSISYFDGQLFVNNTEVAYTNVTAMFTPGVGTDSISITGGTLHLAQTASGSANLSSLNVGSGSSIDIGSDILNLAYTSGNDPESTIQSLITSAYNDGNWNGTGILSSTVAANPTASAIAYYDTGSQIVIRASWKGDANADGVINSDDLSLMMLNQAKGKTDWTAGNFNYDTQVNADDWTIFNFAVAYSNGRNYSNVFASPQVSLESASQMSQILS